jgi:Domain of unknown function (DUF4432)
MTMRLHLHEAMFGDAPKAIADADGVAILGHRLANGIAVLTVKTDRMHLEILPFRGQQIWQAWIDGKPMGMRGMNDAPRAGATLLESFGAFVYHCGLLGIAAPGPEDDHPLHGELPLARMDSAHVRIEGTAGGTQVTVGGSFDFAKAFRAHYRWSPDISLMAGATMFQVTARVENLMRSPLPFMYLAHPNFRPLDGAELVYSAPYDADSVRVRTSVPAHLGDKPGYREQLEMYHASPALHHVLRAGQAFDPEVVFEIDYLADAEGYAHTMQVHPDGQADWIAHRPSDCPVAVRWLSRTPEQDCIALAEPATSGLTGFTEERRRGHVPVLPAGQTWTTSFRIGRLDAAAASAMRARIDALAGRNA